MRNGTAHEPRIPATWARHWYLTYQATGQRLFILGLALLLVLLVVAAAPVIVAGILAGHQVSGPNVIAISAVSSLSTSAVFYKAIPAMLKAVACIEKERRLSSILALRQSAAPTDPALHPDATPLK